MDIRIRKKELYFSWSIPDRSDTRDLLKQSVD